MDSHHHDIIRLAWSRHLGLDDSALRPDHRHTAVDPNATCVTFVRLGDSSALLGPKDALTAAEARTDEELSKRGALGELLKSTAGRTYGPTVLAFADEVGTTLDRHDPLISRELGHVLGLEALCAPDDVIAADLTRKRSWFTLLGDDRPADSAASLSAAAHLEWEGVLADVAVLTAPTARRQGNAQVVARLATNEAFDEGMIPQWRSSAENGTARRLAARLGYEEWGVFISVDLSNPSDADNP
ncbi:GNAT family N-acetyltransferase [Rhodococcus sp. I2R]|uniref:GNAT family N-acetyltransferase n=1 Tax=Rhodococcus sp. I2R TaxID=2855445 RepID=UPI001E5A0D35|nr:GNAT family N-acetyltransferase [Rhodococcus sp. I2R]MCC8928564.1 GNAT family N-acetyltransferase [Rhodococcus sp. I2R]